MPKGKKANRAEVQKRKQRTGSTRPSEVRAMPGTMPPGFTSLFPEVTHPESAQVTVAEVATPQISRRRIPPGRPRTPAPQKKFCEWTESDPPFLVPEWATLACERVSPAQMGRHTLMLGETGSGKTKSGIFPLVSAAVRYGATKKNGGQTPSMLIIDPKFEIADHVDAVNKREKLGRKVNRLVLDENWRIDFFEGLPNGSATGDEYVSRLFAVSPAAEDEMGGSANNAFFTKQAEDILRNLLDIDLHLWRKHGDEGVARLWQNIAESPKQFSFADIDLSITAPSYLDRYAALLNLAGTEQKMVCPAFADHAANAGVPEKDLLVFRSLGELANETFTSIVATINNRMGDLTAPGFAHHIWTNPFRPPPKEGYISVRDALNDGEILCYYPRDTSTVATMVGRALKTKFFELTFARDNLERPFVYVCDEFQRFITNDATSGEQSFLDRCRAYRAICILATQSIASLEYTLGRDGDKSADRLALEILLNNTGNKLFFRNTDLGTHDRLRKLIPSPSSGNKPHITDARPVSTLKVGECYYLLGDGRWGRRQIALASPSE